MSDHFNKIHLSTVQRISCLLQVYATMALFFIRVLRYVCMYMIKIFWEGGRGGDTFKPPPPYKQLSPLPTPCS